MKTKYLGAKVLDVLSGELFTGFVLVEGSRVVRVSRSSEEARSWDAEAWDLSGRYLIPGLIDAHVHLGLMIPDPYHESAFEREAERTLRAYREAKDVLSVGFTTLRVVGEASFIDLALRDAIEKSRVMGPRIIGCGHCIKCTGGHGSNGKIEPLYVSEGIEADGADEVRKAVRVQIKAGVDQIKLLITGGIAGIRENPGESQMTYEEVAAACDAAHRKGLKVSVHAGDAQAIKMAIRAGVDSIEHGYHLDDEGVALMVEKGVWFVPTISVTQDTDFMKKQNWPPHMIERARETGEDHLRAFRAALKAGVKMANGADKNPLRESSPKEIECAVQAGMTPLQALRSSTILAAELCDLERVTGSIEEGKEADLLVLTANPLSDISNIRKIEAVIRSGVRVGHDGVC
ncbi:MAG: amidohydrolase family protein [Bacillota bacterium]